MADSTNFPSWEIDMSNTANHQHRNRRRNRAIALFSALGIAASLTVAGQAAAYGPQSCPTNAKCFAHQAAGSVYYGFASDQLTTVHPFTYDGPGTTYDDPVGDHVGHARLRDSDWVRLCGRKNTSYGGITTVNAPYAGVTWVLASDYGTSSYFSTNAANC